MSEPSRMMKLLLGWFSIFLAFCFLALAPLMVAMEMPWYMGAIAALFSIFPATIAAAMLWPSKRTIAIRALGVMVFVPLFGSIVAQVLARFGVLEMKAGTLRQLIVMVLIAAVALWMAIKGEWPEGSQQESSKPNEPTL